MLPGKRVPCENPIFEITDAGIAMQPYVRGAPASTSFTFTPGMVYPYPCISYKPATTNERMNMAAIS